MADFRKIMYVKRKDIDLDTYESTPEAHKVILAAGFEDNLVLRLRINSPVFIEAAAPLTIEGIESVVSI